MKEKFYSMSATAVDEMGKEHVVTVVGHFTQKVETGITSENVCLNVNENKQVDAVVSFKEKKKVRRLEYSYSICHPDDEFDKEVGIRVAKRRLKERPLGFLETTTVSSLCEDQIDMILFGELQFISNNLNKFLPQE